jgi:integrase
MFLLSIKAGPRAVEIAGLTWDRIDFDGNYLLLKATKGDKPPTRAAQQGAGRCASRIP